MFSYFVMKVLIVLPALIVFLGLSTGSIHAQENDYRKALGLISEKLHQRFPNLRGAVVAVKGADLYLSLGEKDKVVKGVKLGIYREGAPFRHPATGVVLGKLEEEIGEIEVVEVREKFSIARLVRLVPGGQLSSAHQRHGAHVRRENSPGDTAFRQSDERGHQHGDAHEGTRKPTPEERALRRLRRGQAPGMASGDGHRHG